MGIHHGLRKDGAELLLSISLIPTWPDGQLSVTATIRDVTGR